MTVKDLLFEIRRLRPEEQFELLESITRMLREKWQLLQPSGTSLERVRGILKPVGKMPSDAALEDFRDEYLQEKYG